MITYIHPQLKPVALASIQSKFALLGLEITATKISLGQNTAVVLGVYRPPNSKCSWFDLFRDLIINLLPVGKLIIMGDLNCDILRPELPIANSLLMLLELANSHIPTEVILPTRITSSTSSCIDLIAVDRSLKVTDYFIVDFLASDHNPVVASICAPIQSKIKPICKRSFKGVNMNELGTRLSNIELQPISNAAQLDDQLAAWHSQVTTLLDEVAPVRNYPRCCKSPWMNHEPGALIRQRCFVQETKTG